MKWTKRPFSKKKKRGDKPNKSSRKLQRWRNHIPILIHRLTNIHRSNHMRTNQPQRFCRKMATRTDADTNSAFLKKEKTCTWGVCCTLTDVQIRKWQHADQVIHDCQDIVQGWTHLVCHNPAGWRLNSKNENSIDLKKQEPYWILTSTLEPAGIMKSRYVSSSIRRWGIPSGTGTFHLEHIMSSI